MLWRDSLSDLIAAAISDQMNLMFDAGSTLELRTGDAPASLDDADTGTLIITFDLNDPVFGDALESPYRVPMDVTGMSGTNVGTGTIGHFRLKTNAGAVQAQGSCGNSGSGADIIWGPNSTVGGTRTITLLQLLVMLDLVEFEN